MIFLFLPTKASRLINNLFIIIIIIKHSITNTSTKFNICRQISINSQFILVFESLSNFQNISFNATIPKLNHKTFYEL